VIISASTAKDRPIMIDEYPLQQSLAGHGFGTALQAERRPCTRTIGAANRRGGPVPVLVHHAVTPPGTTITTASDARLATLFAKQAATATCALGGSNPRGIERKSMSNPAMLKIVAPLSRTTSSMGIYRANAYSGQHLHRAARPGSRCRPASHFPRERFITGVIAIRQERLCTTTRPAVP
jgi:hypothetical protein